MNFKKLTKITAIAALLCATLPTIAMIKPKEEKAMQSPQKIQLFIQNNTDYAFTITPRVGSEKYTLKAHEFINLDNLSIPAINKDLFTTSFLFDPSVANKNIIAMTIVNFLGDEVSGKGWLDLQEKDTTNKPIKITRLSKIPEYTIFAPDNPTNKFNFFITIAGNKDNNFAGSSIHLEISPEIR
jgi:hypothetical protein